MNSTEDIGLSLVALSLVFACAAMIRRRSQLLRKLFMPTAVIGGFLVLGLGPEGLGRLTGGAGLFPEHVFAIWKQLPGLLINVMCAALLLGERLPPLKSIWNISGPHVMMAGIMSAGQFAVAGVLVLFLLEPVFGFNAKAGALIEMAFAGGHGTLAGLTPVLVEYGAEDLLDVGLGLATIGMVTGIIVGTMLVNYGIKSPSIPIARQNPTSPEEDLDIDHHLPGPDDEPMDEWHGMTQVTAAAVFIGVSIAVGIAMLGLFRWVFNLAGSQFFDKFPLFPFTILGGVLVQLFATRFSFQWAVNRRAVEGLGGIAIDGIVICAIGTLSLGALGANLGPLILLAIASVAWSIFLALVIGRHIFPRHWFEHSMAEFGESQGNVATGFVMLDMVDPARNTDVARAYSYRQLITRPIVGGGFLTALAVPLIDLWGLAMFTIIAVTITVGLVLWGMRRVAVGGRAKVTKLRAS
ncbi:MAG TPA: sodium/glutamate symporter [Steroidobacter sp.]|uniref:sodium/glutamate symporter n=1 Tax=Steroidobacter sp. TaxID=1978227 RepID=UPI002EDAE051